SGPRIGKYTVNQADLDEIGAKSIEDAKQNADIIVIDEVGPMELTSNAFVNAVESAPGSTKPMVLTLHYRASHPLLERIRKEVPERLVMVTLENRATLASEIEGVILRTIPVRKE
ncbi:MAG TPA: nucleoside-triphosphatase, partial [Thermoproteota archaeon]|nr:nucleoside-triphosphatase [Thermoproteota archaeon]